MPAFGRECELRGDGALWRGRQRRAVICELRPLRSSERAGKQGNQFVTQSVC